MNILALIVISYTQGEDSVTYIPLKKMTDILHGNPNKHTTPHEQHLPPIYNLNRTTVYPPHFDTSKPATKSGCRNN